MLLVLTATALIAGQPASPPVPFPVDGPSVTRLEATTAPHADGGPPGGDSFALASLPDDRLTVDVAVGNNGPYRFLVDTAADRSAISRQLATRLNLPAGPEARLHSVAGPSDVRTAKLRGMRISSRTLPDVLAPLLDARHVGADGILGTDVLRSSMVRFDFVRRKLSIAPSSRNRGSEESNTIVVEARRKSGRLIVTQAELDGQRLTVVLDTGSEVSVGNEALRRALAKRRQLSDERPLTLTSVTGAVLPASFMMARQLDIGGVHITGLGIAFAEAHTFKALGIEGRPALLLGMNALEAFDSLTIDMAAKRLRFALPANGVRDRRVARGEPERSPG